MMYFKWWMVEAYFYQTKLGKWWCAYRGHPCGVWFYNQGTLEPDMHCKNCHADLG